MEKVPIIPKLLPMSDITVSPTHSITDATKGGGASSSEKQSCHALNLPAGGDCSGTSFCNSYYFTLIARCWPLQCSICGPCASSFNSNCVEHSQFNVCRYADLASCCFTGHVRRGGGDEWTRAAHPTTGHFLLLNLFCVSSSTSKIHYPNFQKRCSSFYQNFS